MQDCPTCGTEEVLPDPKPHTHDFVGDSDYCTRPGCYLTWGEYRARRKEERE